MNKDRKIYGIDISKDVFDVFSIDSGHSQFKNDEIPILMVLLSKILDNRINKWANIIASIITLAVFATAVPSSDLDDVFHMIIEVAAILWIIQIAWKLPSSKKPKIIN